MSEHDAHTTTNTAESGSTVGIQGGWVHNSTVHITAAPDDPPEHKYRVGVNLLNIGVPSRARERINDAIAEGYENAEVWFHWALAMLSKRSYRELIHDEKAQLGRLPDHLGRSARSEWTRALEMVCELLAHLDDPEHDPAAALTKLWNLPAEHRKKIREHCDLVLTGAMKDSLWAEYRREAEQGQHANDRSHRVWAYFEPDPIPARTSPPVPNSVTLEDQLRTGVATGLLVGAFGCLGWILLQAPTSITIVAYLTLVASAALAAGAGFEWRYRTGRIRAKDFEHLGAFANDDAPEGGFARHVDHRFGYYAHKYSPDSVARSIWLAETRGARTTRRDEVVELYRESRICVGRVNWLIRFLVREVRRRWSHNDLFAYRQQYRTPLATRLWCLSGVAVSVLAAGSIADAVVRTDPLLALASMSVALVAGRSAILRWWHILSERRRCADEERERAHEQATRDAEYRRWTDKLEATRPDEDEMETWLQCDRTLLIDEALRHYRLAWRDITAYTIVQTPAPSCKHARIKNGPWRHSKYELRLFLITLDGVRETVRHINVERGTFHGHERGHFRFDAVSSLRVIESGTSDYTLELTLSNGPTRTIEVTQPKPNVDQANLDEPGLAQISLDSTGFSHALHVLEGISAEGKAWIHHHANPAQTSEPDDPDSQAAA